MTWLNRIAEEKIRDAMERGVFDNHSLKGKRLRLESNAFVPAELRLAYKMLKDAGFLPPEMELRKEIVTLKDLLRTVEDEEARGRLTAKINERVLRLNLIWKRSFHHEDVQVYSRKLREKLG